MSDVLRAGIPAAAAALLVAGCMDITESTSPVVTDEVPPHFTLVDRHSNTALLLERGGRFVNLLMTEPEYRLYTHNVWGPGHAVTLTRRVLQGRFADDFDFVIITFDPEQPRVRPPGGAHSRVSNNVRGLGYSIILPHDQWGGTVRLRSVVMLRHPDNLREGPSLHEIAHHWGATLIPGVEWAHWGLTGVGGQLGGWAPGSLEAVGDGLYRGADPAGDPFRTDGTVGNRIPYAPLELYMMGFLPPDSVPPVEIAFGGRMVDTLTATFRADSIGVRTIDRIVKDFSPRRPAAAESQRHFRVLYVVLGITPLDAQETAVLAHDIEQFTRTAPDDRDGLVNFWEATGGRATIRFDGLVEARAAR